MSQFHQSDYFSPNKSLSVKCFFSHNSTSSRNICEWHRYFFFMHVFLQHNFSIMLILHTFSLAFWNFQSSKAELLDQSSRRKKVGAESVLPMECIQQRRHFVVEQQIGDQKRGMIRSVNIRSVLCLISPLFRGSISVRKGRGREGF